MKVGGATRRNPSAPAASGRLAPSRSATAPAARQRPRPDAENFGGGISRCIVPQRPRRVSQPQSALTPANFTTLPHFSVSSAMSLPRSAGEPASKLPPISASCALILGSARPALISLLSLSTTSGDVFLGAPTPNQTLAS